jgi:hypothetical protein
MGRVQTQQSTPSMWMWMQGTALGIPLKKNIIQANGKVRNLLMLYNDV